MTRVLLLLAVLLAQAPTGAGGQDLPRSTLATRALDLERSGNYAGAVNAYRTLLAETPGQVGALLGLERSLGALGRLGEMTADLAPVLAADSARPVVLAIAVRVQVAAGDHEAAAETVARWARLAPGSEAPWQEWGLAAAARQDFAAGRRALAQGREALGGSALSVELAQLASIEGDYRTAVREWVLTLQRRPEYRAGATAMLGQAPPERRAEILRDLAATRAPVAERLAGVLVARWGDPPSGLARLLAALPRDRAERRDELELFLQEVAGLPLVGARLAEARTHEALADLADAGDAPGHILEAAQAYSDAGDTQAARRMLARLASAGAASREVAGAATLALVGVLVDEGRLQEAEERLADLHGSLPTEDRERLVRRIAEGWLAVGDLDRAERLAVADSSLEGFALGGRIRLFRGDLAGATEWLRAVGPYTGTREEANARLAYLALLQVVARDSVPGLGPALYELARGDSVAGARALASVGRGLPPEAGGAELLLLAGQVLAAQGHAAEAEPVLAASVASAVPAAAAAAALELARLAMAAGRGASARERLEALILAWPGSAVAPEARRLLDQLRGAVPGAR